MRTWVIVVCCLTSLAIAPTAAAQEARRDPFRPLVSENAGSTAVSPGAEEGQPSTSTGTSEQGPATSEGTPNTGMPASDWSALATMLIVLGAGAVSLARLRRPVTVVPRSSRRA